MKRNCLILSKTFVGFVIAVFCGVLMISGCGNNKSPEKILNKVKETYMKINDFHEVTTTETVNKLENKKDKVDTEIYFKKPNKLYYISTSGRVSAIAASNGRDSFLYVSSLNECIRNRAPKNISDFYKKIGGMGLINPSNIILETFLLDGILPSGGIKSSSLEKENEIVGSNSCYVLSISFPTGEKQRLWIGMNDYLIWKNEITITQKALESAINKTDKSDNNDNEKESKELLISTETMKVIDVNKEIPEIKFAYKPPKSVNVVTSFSKATIDAERRSFEGKKAPFFILKDMNGSSINLKGFLGQVVILDFWDSWCKPCAKDMVLMEKLHKRFRDKGLKVIGINDEKDMVKKEKYLKANNITFPILNDTISEVSKTYSVDAVPRLIIIDKNGNVSADFLGLQEESKIMNELKKLGID